LKVDLNNQLWKVYVYLPAGPEVVDRALGLSDDERFSREMPPDRDILTQTCISNELQ